MFTFDLHDSDLPLQIAFPVLTANLIDWLVPEGSARLPVLIQPGDSIPVQLKPETSRIRVTAPDRSRSELPIGESPFVIGSTDQLGLYRLDQLDQSDRVLQSGFLAVNLLDEAESNISPREAIWVGQAEVNAEAGEEERPREFWPWLAAAALAVLSVEWWMSERGRFVGRLDSSLS
jgi:hypothetical protein